MSKNILTVGGSSGLGLELAKRHLDLGFTNFVTGRSNPHAEGINFTPLAISSDIHELRSDIAKLIESLPVIDTLIYSPGFYQEGHITELTEDEILLSINVNLVAAALLIRQLLLKSEKQLKIIGITSSSEYTPREKEPLYTATKAGLGMLLHSISFDPNVSKVLRIAPSGMNTPFWNDPKAGFLDPEWVADETMKLSSGDFSYKYAKITKDPPAVSIVECR
jgi:NAD(P)-dependent dehydrogenase (short-subunit alcohol dehydrogenase family)